MRFWILSTLTVLAASGQSSPYQDMANVKEDIRLLNQRVGELSLKVESLEAENARLQRKAEGSQQQQYVTLVQFNEAIAELNRSFKSAVASSKTETLQHVADQMEKLANQTNAALDSISRPGSSPKPIAATSTPVASSAGNPSSFSDNYPKEGISYTVVKGDTLARIAQKTGAKQADIINANKLSDPSKLNAGRVLFIPGAK